jgi:DNA-binding PadR family transcriptional regulator
MATSESNTAAVQGQNRPRGLQAGVVQEVLLALLAAKPAHGYQLRARLQLALGPLAASLNPGQVYVALGRLERSGLVRSKRVEQSARPDRKTYALTEAGRARVDEWLEDATWPRPAPAEFHLKLVAAAAAGLADPLRLIERQRHALLAELGVAQRAALAEAEESVAGLLLEGVVLRLQSDLRWLEQCVRFWTPEGKR